MAVKKTASRRVAVSMSDAAVREVSWGDGLVVAAFHSQGGMKVAVDRIRAVVGDYIGTRNTFGKLLRLDSPQEIAERDLFRAWLLLTALDQDPAEWGIPDDVVPPAHSIETLKAALAAPTPPDGEEAGRPRQESNLRPFAYEVGVPSLRLAA